MTARELTIPGQGNRFTIEGEGYGTVGKISHVGGKQVGLDPFLLPMVLCSDAVLDGEALIGDPTEGALIVLAAKGGLDIAETRRAYPRVAEVPFDSDYKFMATFHNMTTAQGKAGRALLRQGRAGRAHRPQQRLLEPRRRLRRHHRRQPPAGAGRERPAGGRRDAGDGGRRARLRPGDLRPAGQPARL